MPAPNTTQSRDFLKELIKAGIHQPAAERIEKVYEHEPDFLYGLDVIAQWYYFKTIPSKAKPKGEPWSNIYDLMISELQTGLVDIPQALINVMNKLNIDFLIQGDLLSIVGKKAHDIEKFEDVKNKKKNFSSADYITQTKQFGYSFEYNILTGHIEVNGEELTDPMAAKIRSQFRDAGMRKTIEIEDAILSNAYDNSYHPIKRYLEDLKWDGQDRFSDLVTCFQSNTPLFEIYLRKFLLGAIRRIYERYQNYVLCLVGAQKIGKSKFVKWLNPLTQYYADTSINPDDKDSVMRLATKWVCELPELGAITRRADREALKAFLSKEEITIRRPYGRNDETRPVLASFVGTFNNEGGILNDSTGSRRFVISEIQKITWDDYLKIDINQLWAQLFVAYKGGEETELSQTEYEESERNNRENFEVINPLEDLLTDRYFIDPDQPRLFETASSIFDYVISKDFKYFSPTQLSMDISRTLLKLGAQKTSRRIGGKVTRIFTGVEKII